MWQKINNLVYGSYSKAVFSMALVSTIIVVVLITAFGLTTQGWDDVAGLAFFTVGQIVLSIITLLLMHKLNVLNSTDFTIKGKAKGFLLGWVCIVIFTGNTVLNFMSIPYGSFVSPDPLHLIVVALHPFAGTGLFEEVLFRGLVLLVLLKVMEKNKKGMMSAVIISSVIFGLVHLVNLTVADTLPVVIQVFSATGIGVFFAAMYLRTKTLVIPIILHGIVNVSSRIQAPFTYVPQYVYSVHEYNDGTNIGGLLIFLAVGIVHLIVGLILLRKAEPNQH
jgi:membrane protease YdiL (CAAX protease family)